MLLALLSACSEYDVTKQEDDPPAETTPDPDPDVVVDPVEIDFGEYAVGETSDAWLVTISNVGEAPLGIDGVALADAGPFTVTSAGSALLEPGTDTTFTVTFQPDSAGLATGDVIVSTSDPDEPEVAVALRGGALAPDIAVDPAEYDFGTLDRRPAGLAA